LVFVLAGVCGASSFDENEQKAARYQYELNLF
jgi:hypothetical protein